MKINKDRTYTTRDGRAAKQVHINEGFDCIIMMIQESDGLWKGHNYPKNGQCQNYDMQLIEALKPNGIPVDIPSPDPAEGHSWRVIGHHDEIKLKKGMMWSRFSSGIWTCQSTALTPADIDDDTPVNGFYIEYIPDPVEYITQEKAEIRLSAILGKAVKIIK